MSNYSSIAPNRSKVLLSWLAVVFLTFFAGKFILKDALPYFGFEEVVFGRFWMMKWPLIGHITGGLIALTLGPFQFWNAFRNKYLYVHRWMGVGYILGILIAVISSIALSLTTGLAIHWTWSLALLGLAAVWFSPYFRSLVIPIFDFRVGSIAHLG